MVTDNSHCKHVAGMLKILRLFEMCLRLMKMKCVLIFMVIKILTAFSTLFVIMVDK